MKKKEQAGKALPLADGKGLKKSSKASTFFLSKVVQHFFSALYDSATPLISIGLLQCTVHL